MLVATTTARKASIAPTKNKLVDKLTVTGLGKLYHIISGVYYMVNQKNYPYIIIKNYKKYNHT